MSPNSQDEEMKREENTQEENSSSENLNDSNNNEASENTQTKKKGPVTKEKLRSIMEAASALTSLGDEDEECKDVDDEESSKDKAKRFIPEYKKPDAALTFPEKLMNMMKFADEFAGDKKHHCVAWLSDGKSFVIRNPDEFTRNVLPKYFKATKFSSFTRKLYRWGFRQVNRGIGPDDPIIFGNEHFQRDNAELMAKMRSVTAAGIRKSQSLEAAQAQIEAQRKRPLDPSSFFEDPRKRLFLELQQQQHQKMMQEQQFNLANALRPGFMKPMGGFPQAFQQGNMNPLQLYLPQPQQQMQGNPQHHQQQNQQQFQNMGPHQGQQSFTSPGSTADIVNAAINALRYSS
mmetsp:Transcript_42051/g.59073  ORF Transcript_42051/g.59073 Transcript_42051/m.59073 type:complete len:346 (-) Transcript_42051:65-1102(-)